MSRKLKNFCRKICKISPENGTIEFRHYAIQSRLGAKKKIQNLLNSNKEIPDLGKYNSIEEYMNAMSGSGPRIHMVRGSGGIWIFKVIKSLLID